MFSKASSALAAIVFLQQLGAATAQSSSSTYSADFSTSTACPSKGGVHVIIARGSLETPPYGVQVAVKDRILAQFPGSTADGTIGYPNTLADYFNSETAGVIVAKGLITDFVARCPGSPLVLGGYSQGANVLGDALIGQKDTGFPTNASVSDPLPASVLAQVAAVVLYGDPTFVASEPFLVGNATKNGSFPRLNSELFSSTGLASKMQSYCTAGDLFCAGGDSIVIHASYLPRVSDSVLDFVTKQVAAWYSANGSSGSASASGVVPVAPKPTASASASASSACQSKASRSGIATGTVSQSYVSPSATPSSTPSSTTSSGGAVSTGAASGLNVEMGMIAGAGALVAGLFALL